MEGESKEESSGEISGTKEGNTNIDNYGTPEKSIGAEDELSGNGTESSLKNPTIDSQNIEELIDQNPSTMY